jgi:hypothetical protein
MDFWKTFYEYKDTISKSFSYIYKNCPDKEGYYNAFNNLIVQLYELNVFSKFNENKTKKNNKKFQQFLFMWIYKILHDTYKYNKNIQNRFKHVNVDNNIDVNSILSVEKTNTKIDPKDNRQGKKYPPHYNNVSFTSFSPDKNIEYQQTKNLIFNTLKKDIYKKIIILLEQGYSKKEISEKLNISSQYLSLCLNKIKEKVNTLKEVLI